MQRVSYKLLVPLLLIPIVVGIFFLIGKNLPSSDTKLPFFPTPTIFQGTISRFSILSTMPQDNDVDVYTGEIDVVFTADAMLSQKDFTFQILPAVPNYWRFTNTFPSSTVTVKIYGGLKPSTVYTATVSNKLGDVIKSWSFTTSSKEAEASSGLVVDDETNYIKKYYPLLQYVRYSNSDFEVDYTDKLTLEVKVKNPDLEKVKADVDKWIRSHGIDPTTHTINYIQ